jgi:hypothetical protein
MTTSGSVDYSLDARAAITAALELVGTCAIGLTPDAGNTALALKHANLMLKTWGTQDRLWISSEAVLTLVASTASYSVPLARRLVSAYRRTGTGVSTNDLDLNVISHAEYAAKPAKFSTGSPIDVYHDPQRSTRTLYVWPVPDATIAASTTIRYTYLRVIEDIDALANDLDIPQEWLETFVYALAARLLIPFRRFVSDPITAAKIEQRASTLYAELSAQDGEDASVFFQPA